MQVNIEAFSRSAEVFSALERGGWKVDIRSNEGGKMNALCSHPAAKDEQAARVKLYKDGLLLSANIRIKFESYLCR
jgi:hypothetical protein